METKTISIKKKFTEDELNEIAVQISEKIQSFYSIEEDKRRATSSFNADLKVLKNDIQKLVSQKTLGYCWEERTCKVRNEYAINERRYIDLVTNEVVKTEPIDGDSSLFEEAKALANELNEVGEFKIREKEAV